jgi:hypothetical protein
VARPTRWSRRRALPIVALSMSIAALGILTFALRGAFQLDRPSALGLRRWRKVTVCTGKNQKKFRFLLIGFRLRHQILILCFVVKYFLVIGHSSKYINTLCVY